MGIVAGITGSILDRAMKVLGVADLLPQILMAGEAKVGLKVLKKGLIIGGVWLVTVHAAPGFYRRMAVFGLLNSGDNLRV